MKHAGILALVVLTIALVALAWWASTRTSPHETVLRTPDSVAPTLASSAELEAPTLELNSVAAAAVPAEREPIDAQPASTTPTAAAVDARVHVEVLYADSNRPVRGAKVFVGPPPTEGVTDEHGVLDLPLPEGSTLVDVRAEATEEGDRFVPYQRELGQLVRAGRNTILVRVDRGIDLHGLVRDAATGRAIAGAHIRYHGFGQRTRIDSREDGSFDCVALLVNARNVQPLEVQSEGYLPAVLKPDANVLDPGAAPILILLETGIVLSGRIVDADRAPVAGAHLTLSTTSSSWANSDELGRFEFRGIAPSEHASLYAQAQSSSSPPIVDASLDLGALIASRFDVELQVQSALELRVFAELADGTTLDPREFEIDWGDGSLASPGILAPPLDLPTSKAKSRVLPRGLEFDVRALARAPGTTDRAAIVSASAHVSTARGVASPLDVRLRLAPAGRLEIPPVPAGVPELDLDEGPGLRGAIDVRIVDDATGVPITGGKSISLRLFRAQPNDHWINPGPNGWARLWQRIGVRTLDLEADGAVGAAVTLSVPLSGYATTEWRVRFSP